MLNRKEDTENGNHLYRESSHFHCRVDEQLERRLFHFVRHSTTILFFPHLGLFACTNAFLESENNRELQSTEQKIISSSSPCPRPGFPRCCSKGAREGELRIVCCFGKAGYLRTGPKPIQVGGGLPLGCKGIWIKLFWNCWNV